MSVPRATYRLQLGPGLGFADAQALVPYLRELGISHLYLSPSLQARSGSTHGYDVVDPTRLSEALGGQAAFRKLAAAVHDAGMGILLDIVPNHMGIGEENRWWSDETLRAKFFDLDPATGRHRRFFDIDDLAGLRQEDPEVFETTHRTVLSLVREGLVEGLRIDHPDGLADPAGYLRRLREEGAEHVWVEKILEVGEELRDWPVEGTVGYEFLNDVAALYVDRAGEAPLTALYAELTGERRPFAALALAAQVEQARGPFAPEVERLARLTDLPGIEHALAALPVYRTYVEPWSGRVEDADREAVEEAGIDGALAGALLLEPDGAAAEGATADAGEFVTRFQQTSPPQRRVPDEFVTRFQQTSPPITAKGIEDTAFYRYVRLVALNDVGGDPARFGIDVATFHARTARRAARFPHSLLTTQTHDTKRSGDVRARIGALAGMAAAWREAVLSWRELTAELRTELDGREAPDANEQYLIFQTLIGAWPISQERLAGYLEKALREAKVNSNWVEPDAAWEEAVQRFAGELLGHRPFLDAFEPFARRVAAEGRRAALGQLLLKLTVPGIPDVYQGDELEALSLVDPDNRRAIDWEMRRDALARLAAGDSPTEQTRKLLLIQRALQLRARRPEAFDGGDYEPLDAGPGVVAFARGGAVIAVAPVRDWADATLRVPTALVGSWHDVLTGQTRTLAGGTPVAALVEPHSVALLERRD
jgi:(1->4)-alpha-D-glucan 1-alpha-D-glucosylmutase